MAEVVAEGVPAGGPTATVSGHVLGPVGELAVLAVGLLAPPQLGLPDPTWLAPGALEFAAIGAPQTGAPLSATFAVPPTPDLHGFLLTWQGVSLSGGALRASNPAIAVVQ